MSVLVTLGSCVPVAEAYSQADFNPYINDAVKMLLKERGDRGFDQQCACPTCKKGERGCLSAYYSQDLDYAAMGETGHGVIKYGPGGAERKKLLDGEFFEPKYEKAKRDKYMVGRPKTNPTICVASVTEAIIEALNLYYKDKKSQFSEDERRTQLMQLPSRKWSRFPDRPYPKKMDIQPYLNGVSWQTCRDPRKTVQISRSTGEALQIFGIGTTLPEEPDASGARRTPRNSLDELQDVLQPGDFINFDRPRKDVAGGHAVIFMKWLRDRSNKIIGFTYFSAQVATKGFGLIDGYFVTDDKKKPCPVESSRSEHPSDCGIHKNFLFGGRMWHPARWSVDKRMIALERWLVDKGLRCGSKGELDDSDPGVPSLFQDSSAETETEVLYPDMPNESIDGIIQTGQ